MVEVKSGLFEGDMIVSQRAPQLYAQSLRGGGKAEEHTLTVLSNLGSRGAGRKEAVSNFSLPWWVGVGGGTALATVAFIAGSFWVSRRSKLHLLYLTQRRKDAEQNVN